MTAKKGIADFQKALKFFESSGYLKIIEKRPQSPRAFVFGATGGLLMHNLLAEWFSSTVLLRENVSLVQPSTLQYCAKSGFPRPRRSLSQSCAEFYADTLQLNSGRLPVGLAVTGRCLNEENDSDAILDVKGPEEYTECLLQYYLPEKLVTEMFNRLEVDRLMWWRNLSNSKEITAARSPDGKSSDIVYSSHGCGFGSVENLRVSGPLVSLPQAPFMIEARVVADVAALVFLYDAYSERDDDEGSHVAIELHERLAPYKLGVSVEGSCVEELNFLASYIREQLEREEILVRSTSSNNSLLRLQQLGIPFLVTLSDNTLDDGTVVFHDLSASTKEVVHLTKLRDKVVSYVKY